MTYLKTKGLTKVVESCLFSPRALSIWGNTRTRRRRKRSMEDTLEDVILVLSLNLLMSDDQYDSFVKMSSVDRESGKKKIFNERNEKMF